jgi:hypothetical protein
MTWRAIFARLYPLRREKVVPLYAQTGGSIGREQSMTCTLRLNAHTAAGAEEEDEIQRRSSDCSQ